MALISTAGGATSNSFTSVTFADNYLLTERVGVSGWDSYGNGQKEAALIQATRELERERFKGARVTTTQALSFPRSGIFNENLIEYSNLTVPVAVQQATAELAYQILVEDAAGSTLTADGLDLSAFKSVKIGDFAAELREGQSSGYPAQVKILLRDFILTNQARVVRG